MPFHFSCTGEFGSTVTGNNTTILYRELRTEWKTLIRSNRASTDTFIHHASIKEPLDRKNRPFQNNTSLLPTRNGYFFQRKDLSHSSLPRIPRWSLQVSIIEGLIETFNNGHERQRGFEGESIWNDVTGSQLNGLFKKIMFENDKAGINSRGIVENRLELDIGIRMVS